MCLNARVRGLGWEGLMFFYDHAMSRDDFMDHHHEPEPMGEIDMMDGLRAMALFKRNPGPLDPMDISQDVKEELSTAPTAFMELCADGFISDGLKREIEQMIKDRTFYSDQTESRLPSSFMLTFTGPEVHMRDGYSYQYEYGNPKKKNIPTNPKLYARVKAEAKRKFDVYPSAYANAWLVREYKKRGGGYRKG
jgi:hypothetical protein